MTKRHARLGFTPNIPAWIFSLVLCAKVMREIMSHELGAVGVEAIDSVGFPKGVMNGRIESAGRDQGAKLGYRIGKMQTLGHFGGSFRIARGQLPNDVDRVSKFLIRAGDLGDLLRQRSHRSQFGIVRQFVGRKGESVVQWKRSESFRFLA